MLFYDPLYYIYIVPFVFVILSVKRYIQLLDIMGRDYKLIMTPIISEKLSAMCRDFQ